MTVTMVSVSAYFSGATSVRVLIVEDEVLSAMYMQLILENAGYEVVGLETKGEEALRNAADTSPDIALVDIHLQGGMDGLDVAAEMRATFGIPSLFVTAYSPEELKGKDRRLTPEDVITKPIQEGVLKRRIERILDTGT